jgi:aspartyl-tRNA(Asn)/glutamyl-tRNA(Gln) amidotransferase subunit A
LNSELRKPIAMNLEVRSSNKQIVEVAPLIRSGALLPIDLVRNCLDQIAARPKVNAFITVLRDSALDEAERASSEILAGRWRGLLHGIPIAVKDLIDVVGTRTTAGSAVPSIDAVTDAPVIRRLREAGAIIVGKTNLHEFAFGTTSEESAFGPVRNPHDESRSAGGSSGGSAAALAAGMCFGAIGTDTGGSIRIPSAACGTVGLKPTYAELPTDGVVPLSTTLDHVGPMARSVADTAILFQIMKGIQPAGVPAARQPLVFGMPGPYFTDHVDEDVARALATVKETLTGAGHRIVDAEIENARITADVYLHIVLPEASWYHAPLLERHVARYSPGVRLRLEMGRYVLAEDYVRAMKLRDVLTRSVDRSLEHCDVLLLPTLPMAAPLLGSSTIEIKGRTEPVRGAMLRLTQLFNLTGHPAVALPAGLGRDGLPRGLQLVGRRNATEGLLAIAAQISGGPGSVGGGTG